MNKKSTTHINLEALLAEMPVEPSADFAERVLADYKIENLLREMPLEAKKDFAEKTLAKATPSRKPHTQLLRLAHLAAAASVAATSAVLLWKTEFIGKTEITLASRIEQTVQNDPELSALAQAEDDSLFFDELLNTSEILSNIDPTVLEIFAYND